MKSFIIVAVTAILSSCATERPARAAALDPSNPAAPEASPLAAVTLERAPLSMTPTASTSATKPEHDHGGAKGEATSKDEGAAKGEATYTCPMHPEVVSPKPGKCPKCGMKLVPKAPSPAPEKTK